MLNKLKAQVKTKLTLVSKVITKHPDESLTILGLVAVGVGILGYNKSENAAEKISAGITIGKGVILTAMSLGSMAEEAKDRSRSVKKNDFQYGNFLARYADEDRSNTYGPCDQSDMRSFFDTLNLLVIIGGFKIVTTTGMKKDGTPVGVALYQGKIITNDVELAECLRKHFKTIFQEVEVKESLMAIASHDWS